MEFNQKLAFGNTSLNRYETYSNYKRGQAQSITVPARYDAGTESKTAIMNDTVFGSTINTTDYNNNQVEFGYDHIGRPLYIDHVDGTVADTLYKYISGAAAVEVPATAAVSPVDTIYRCQLNTDKTACTNTAFTITPTYDGYLNPVLQASNDNTRTLYKNYRYNVFNRAVFASYPSTSSTYTLGLTYNYDALQRKTSASQSNGGTIFTEYLVGNKTKVTDAVNNVTTTTYLDYALPTYKQPTRIVSPENLTTDLDVNVFGEVKSITQSGKNGSAIVTQTQTNLYDSNHQLCMIKRSDVGNTYISRNVLGQVVWQAEGVSGDTCTANGATDSQKLAFGYDNLGNQSTINYGNGSTQRIYKLDGNGNIKTIQGDGYSHSYNYTSTNKLDDETLNILADGKSLTLDYGYNSMGHLASLKYPGNVSQINFAPNGYGQATQAIRVYSEDNTVEFVKAGANYYPSGVMATFTYGNGVVHTSSINTRGMPEQLHDSINNTDVVNLTYSYDFNNNITSIGNPRDNGIFELTALTYDGLDRLTETQGGTGIGSSSISYDSLGNIRTYSNDSLFKSHDLTYVYDSNFRLTGLTGNGSAGYDFAQATTANSDAHDSYNARGNVIHNGKRNFNYNLANQMTSSGSNTYLYDGFSRRIKTQDSKGTGYSMYSQSGTLLYRETSQGGINYVYLGNKLVAKEGTGVVVASDSIKHYKPFGESIETAENDVGYTGHKFDTDLGLNYMQARYYDPAIGRFYSDDPIGIRDVHSFNRYVYANNNPYKYTDPHGEAVKIIVTSAKSLYKLYRRYKRKGSLDKKDVKEILGDEAIGIIGDLETLFDSDSSVVDKVKAGLDLVAGTETNSKGDQAAKRLFSGLSAAGKKLETSLDKMGQKIEGLTGKAANTMLRKMAQQAGLKVEAGGKHLKIKLKDGRSITIPHSPHGKGTIKSIIKQIKKAANYD